MKQGLALWWAARELIRAGDTAREVASVGRITKADVDRLHEADRQWTIARAEANR